MSRICPFLSSYVAAFALHPKSQPPTPQLSWAGPSPEPHIVEQGKAHPQDHKPQAQNTVLCRQEWDLAPLGHSFARGQAFKNL